MARVCPVCGAAEVDDSGCLAQFLALLDTPVPPPDPKHESVRNYTPTEALALARRGFEERNAQRLAELKATRIANALAGKRDDGTPIVDATIQGTTSFSKADYMASFTTPARQKTPDEIAADLRGGA